MLTILYLHLQILSLDHGPDTGFLILAWRVMYITPCYKNFLHTDFQKSRENPSNTVRWQKILTFHIQMCKANVTTLFSYNSSTLSHRNQLAR